MTSEKRTPWQAGGYSLWLASENLTDIVAPVARKLSRSYRNSTPVDNNVHVTLAGNLYKGIDLSRSERIKVEQSLNQAAAHIGERLLASPLTLRFTDINSNPSKPSQAIYLAADQTLEWQSLLKYVYRELNLKVPDSLTPPHASILYNHSTDYPLTNNTVTHQVIPYCRNNISLPFDSIMDRVVLVRTKGIPKKWVPMSIWLL